MLMLMLLLMERTLPSNITAFTMPACRLRAAIIGGLLAVGMPVHGGFGARLTQMADSSSRVT